MNISFFKKLKNKLTSGLNNLLYDSKDKAFFLIKIITFIASIAAIGILVYVYGFEPALKNVETAFTFLDFIFGIFLLTFCIRLVYSFQKTEFIKSHTLEATLMTLIFLNIILSIFFNERVVENLLLHFFSENVISFYRIFISFYIFIILALEFTKFNASLSTLKIQPSTTFILSFLVLSLAGTGLLMLPAMTVGNEGIFWLDALFTSVSATCVTGLIVVDTATYFTFKGQVVILALIQLGGLGIVSFASFFSMYIKGGVGIKHHAMVQDFTSSESLNTAKGLLRKVIFITFFIEGITFVLLYFTWGEGVIFANIKDKIFFTVFHAISAFCNAGFSLFSLNLYESAMREAYVFHIIIAAAVILGGIGFNTIEDLFYPSSLRKRLQRPWIDWKVSTKIAVWVSLALLIFGTIGFYFLERNNSLSGKNFLEIIITSFFHSAMRTSGFNTVDIGNLLIPTLIMLMFLMFVGGSSNSIAGGIKTSTFYLIVASTLATIRGKEKIEFGNRFLPNSLLFKALSVFSFAVVINSTSIFILSITEPEINIANLAFEQISAFGTVGFSTGITDQLSIVGKIVIIVSMFLGRVGTLTFAYALSTRSAISNYKYPKDYIMVG